MNARKSFYTAWPVEYGGVALLTIVLLYFVLTLWNMDLFMPNAYYGDGWSYLAIIKGMVEPGLSGWVLHVDRLGAPTGAMLYDSMVYQQAGLHNAIMKLIGLVVPNENFVINVYYLLSFPLISVFTYLFMREANIARPFALLGAVLGAFAPYHYSRNTVHIYLSCYYMVPLACLVLLWLMQRRLSWETGESWGALWRKPRFRAAALIVLQLAMSDAYYTFFMLLVLGLLMGIALFAGGQARWRQIGLMITLVGVIGCGALVLVIPTLPEKMSHPNPEAGIYPLKRDYYMADYNSLRMDTMLLPTIMHRIAPVSHRVIQYQHWLQIHGETIAASIGLIPAVGFMLGLSFIFLGVRRRENSLIPFMPAEIDNVLRHFSAANLWLLLIGISSGFGVLIATIFPDIRCYMRVCLYILFFSLLIFCLVVDYGTSRFFPRKNMIIAWGLAVLLAAFGLWDQTGTGEAFMMGESPLNKPAVEAKLERYRINDAFIRKVEQELPPGAMVFELPYLSFWTYDGPANHVEYDQLVPYLHSKKLKWSYGSIVGTAVDLWQRHAVRKPMEDFLREISTMGFSAVYVDREGYADNGDSIVAQLHDHLNTEPLVSADGRRLVFKLTSVGFVVKVDPYTYWPRTLTITDRALFSPSALPDYVFADKLAATLQRHAEPQVTLKGAELEGVLDHDMLKVLTSYSHEPMPDAAFKGNLSCADNAVVTLAAADHRAYYTLPLTITNDSDFWWNFDAGRVLPLSVRSHLLDADRKMKDVDYIYQVFVATPIRPHSSKTVQAVFSTHFLKTLEGIHYVQLDIVQEGVAWMTGKTGNKLCTIKTQNTEGLLGHEGP